jgi:LPXTG-motif cell wall-anchored protein
MSLKVRGFAAIALAAAISVAPAPAASAAQSSAAAPQISILLPDVLLGEDSFDKLVRPTLYSSEQVVATNFKLVLDWSDLTGVVTIEPWTFDSRCSTVGAVLTCLFPRQLLNGASGGIPHLRVKPVAGVQAGASGKWKVTVSADGLTAVSAESTMEVAEAVDLAVPGGNLSINSTPGGTFPQTLEIDNIGDRAADGAVLVVHSDHAFVTTKQYSNCTFLNGRMRSCTFDEQLAVGGSYATSEPVPFKLREDTLAPGKQSLGLEWMTKADFSIFKKELADIGMPDFFGQPGTGGKLTLAARPQADAKAAQTEIVPSNNFLRILVHVEGDNDADLAAVGGAAAGAAGQIVTVDLGIKNHGPATRDTSTGFSFDFASTVTDVTLPPGSSLAEMPRGCVAMKSLGESGERDPDQDNLATRFIRCYDGESLLIAGDQMLLPVKLRIDQVITGAAGSILINGCIDCRRDKNPANDTATVVLNSASLPVTGVQTGLIAGVGALLALMGAAVLVFGRRRRFKAAGAE